MDSVDIRAIMGLRDASASKNDGDYVGDEYKDNVEGGDNDHVKEERLQKVKTWILQLTGQLQGVTGQKIEFT